MVFHLKIKDINFICKKKFKLGTRIRPFCSFVNKSCMKQTEK